MSSLLVSLLAALLGVLLDKLAAWQQAGSASSAAMAQDRLLRRIEVERINRQIDEEIERESDLRVLVDRL